MRNLGGRLRAMQLGDVRSGKVQAHHRETSWGSSTSECLCPHRKFVGHAFPHRSELGAPRDAGESVQGTVDAGLVTGEGRALGTHMGNPGGLTW